ncbi:hypothetical protein ACFSTC_13290 [Nonomuraea ferruginea]
MADAGRVPVAGGQCRSGAGESAVGGRQVPPAGELAREPDRLWREIRRVLARDGLVVALSYDEGGDPPGFETVERVEVSLSGRHPVLAVLRLRERRRASRGRAG